MTVIGIDPGKKGAMAIIESTPDGIGHVKIIPFEPSDYISALKRYSGATVCIEQVQSLPREGVKSVWSFGQTYGWLLGVMDALGVSYQAVPPNKWKREYSLLRAEKKQSIEVCKRLFPNVSLKRTDRCKTDDDNMADSLLLCEYARRHF